jgi:hypothetical protein
VTAAATFNQNFYKVWHTKQMALFTRKPEPAKIVKAAAGSASSRTGSNAGASQIGNFYAYSDGSIRQRFMQVPTISRSRDLMCSVIGCLKLEQFKEMWNGEKIELMPEAPRSWLARIDKSVTNNFILSFTLDDLLFYGRAFWYVTERDSSGYPSSFTRLPAAIVTTQDQAATNGVWFGPSKQVLFQGLPIRHEDLIQFLSPIQGLIFTGAVSVDTALKLEQARNRNASSLQPAVTLRQTGGEPMSPQELRDLAAAYDEARFASATSAVNEFVEVIPNTATPDKMLLIDAAEYQAKELARIANVPAYLVSVSIGNYSYVSSSEASRDLYKFGVKPYIDCIQETLSANNVLPRGTVVRFDIESYLASEYNETENEVEINETTVTNA